MSRTQEHGSDLIFLYAKEIRTVDTVISVPQTQLRVRAHPPSETEVESSAGSCSYVTPARSDTRELQPGGLSQPTLLIFSPGRRSV
jgi:hypothetical protein